jgi:hypothetical protein
MVLRGLQALIGRLYDVELRYDVYDFLVTDRRAVSGYAPNDDCHGAEEELLLAERLDACGGRSGGAGVALYLDPQLLSRLELADPQHSLTPGNLSDYCTALEGVSHFVYSTWRLEYDLPVSLLELETQAEVDKYAVTVFLLGAQQGGIYPAHVHSQLFDRVSFDTRLAPAQVERYQTAHRCAARYCRRLERTFVNRGVARIEALVRELRRFYRLGASAKLSHALA